MSQHLQPSNAPPPATLIMNQMVYGFWVSRCLQIAAELRLADTIGDTPKTVEELAAASGTHAPSLARMLRLLSGVGVMVKDEQTQRWALTEMGALLRKDHPGSVHGSLMAHGHPLSWRAWGELKTSLTTGKPVVEQLVGETFFEFMGSHPKDGAMFQESMVAYQLQNAPAVVNAYDFSTARTICDVGGGTGALLAHILQRHPAARGTIFETPLVTKEARAKLAEQGLTERCDAIEGDFFASSPKGQDIYILSQILHDWNDENSLRILTQIRQAMRPDSRLLIVEAVLPGDNANHFGNLYDMAMLILLGGKERTETEYKALVAKAGLRVSRIVPTSMPPSIVEVVPA
jgi:C-methyltransferase